MTTARYGRKLTAVLSADVKGYSRLMGEDEEGTLYTLTAYREVMTDLIQKHRGRVVDSPGDNVLAEFTSVVDAVRCAVEIQEELKARNAGLAENRKMEFRIGVNLGDVIVEEDRIHGEGVNIAARMEGLAEGGGICISGTVYDQVENKLSLDYESLGERTLKNISKPVRVYRIRMKADVFLRERDKDLKLPDRPSIAVLPFVNISGDLEQEYFSDGITEDLITDLSKISGLFVIARNSVFTYKGRAVRVDQVGRELGVRYVLEGSVRKVGGRVRISAQLIDAATTGHVWAERYDRDLQDIFALQDDVTQKIVTTLAVKLTQGEEDRLTRRDTDNIDAYDHTLRGLDHYYRFSKDSNLQARDMFAKAIDLDPGYALAYSRLGWTHLREWSLGWSQDVQSLERARELAQKAVSLDDSLADAHELLGEVYLWQKRHDQAVEEVKRAIILEPNNAEALADLGHILTWAGRPEEAIGLAKKAIRLSPVLQIQYLWVLGHAYFLMKRYDEAVATLKRAINLHPDFLPAHAFLGATYAELGRCDEARAEAAESSRCSANLPLEALMDRLPYKDPAVLARLFEALRKAGAK
jgi:adenylate cyclase